MKLSCIISFSFRQNPLLMTIMGPLTPFDLFRFCVLFYHFFVRISIRFLVVCFFFFLPFKLFDTHAKVFLLSYSLAPHIINMLAQKCRFVTLPLTISLPRRIHLVRTCCGCCCWPCIEITFTGEMGFSLLFLLQHCGDYATPKQFLARRRGGYYERKRGIIRAELSILCEICLRHSVNYSDLIGNKIFE